MTELVRFTVRESGSVVFEVEEPTAGIGQVSRSRRVRDVKAAFEEHLNGVRDAASATLEVMRSAGPDEVKISFGVKLTLEAGAVVARTTGEGHMDVEMVWRREESSSQPGPGTAEGAQSAPAASSSAPAASTTATSAPGGPGAAGP